MDTYLFISLSAIDHATSDGPALSALVAMLKKCLLKFVWEVYFLYEPSLQKVEGTVPGLCKEPKTTCKAQGPIYEIHSPVNNRAGPVLAIL